MYRFITFVIFFLINITVYSNSDYLEVTSKTSPFIIIRNNKFIVKPTAVEFLVTELRKQKRTDIKEIYVHCGILKTKDIHTLGKYLNEFKPSVMLSLTGCDLENQHIQILASYIRTSNISGIDLCSNKLEAAALKYLSEAILAYKKINHIGICYNNLSKKSILKFITVLRGVDIGRLDKEQYVDKWAR